MVSPHLVKFISKCGYFYWETIKKTRLHLSYILTAITPIKVFDLKYHVTRAASFLTCFEIYLNTNDNHTVG